MPVVDGKEVRGIVVGVFQENCYIVASPRAREAIVIDPGDEPERVLELARDMGVNVKLIVATHTHGDHIMGVRGVRAKTAAPFLVHAREAPILERGMARMYEMLGRPEEPPPRPDRFIADGETLGVAGLDLRAIHTPGHTPGSISYYVNGLLFSGDTLFRGSIGRTDMPGGSYQQIMEGILTRLMALPDDTIVLPGHEMESTIRQERFTNPFVQQELRRLRQE